MRLAIAAVLVLSTIGAGAQMQGCATEEVVDWAAWKALDQLEIANGKAGEGEITAKLYVSPSDGSWSVVLKMTNGLWCPRLLGTDWQEVEAAIPEDPPDAVPEARPANTGPLLGA